jgi:hypothetical protein
MSPPISPFSQRVKLVGLWCAHMWQPAHNNTPFSVHQRVDLNLRE